MVGGLEEESEEVSSSSLLLECRLPKAHWERYPLLLPFRSQRAFLCSTNMMTNSRHNNQLPSTKEDPLAVAICDIYPLQCQCGDRSECLIDQEAWRGTLQEYWSDEWEVWCPPPTYQEPWRPPQRHRRPNPGKCWCYWSIWEVPAGSCASCLKHWEPHHSIKEVKTNRKRRKLG